MIEIENAESFRCCNVCYSKEKVCNITFRCEGTNNGTQVALCKECMKKLADKIYGETDENA